MKRKRLAMHISVSLLVAAFTLTACQPVQTQSGLPPTSVQAIELTPTTAATASPKSSNTPAATFVPETPTLTAEPDLEVCSPLGQINIADLPSIVSNPFEAPPAGRDDGHHGVDLAFYRFGELTSMQGVAVNAVFPGKVVGIINNRPPYGYAVVIETDLLSVEAAYPQLVNALPTQGVIEPHPALYCPDKQVPAYDTTRESLYLLYAHLNLPPLVALGEQVSCGQTLGEVGTSGMSVNLHLHLEGRVGPADYHFASMAHYENAATQEEMANYCLWRVTNTFRMFDPMLFFTPQANMP